MGTLALKGERRSDVGKGVARKLRMTGRIPAVYYGRGEEPIPLVVSLKELEELIHSAEGSNVSRVRTSCSASMTQISARGSPAFVTRRWPSGESLRS